jgi:predicted RNA-binding Zn ribbon-like protein
LLFAHDTEVALAAAAALVNTALAEVDELAATTDLDEFVRTWQWTGRRAGDHDELEAVRALRPKLLRLWELDEDGAVEAVNALLRDAQALPQLVKHDTWDYHLHATPSDAPLAERMAVEAAMAMIDVIRLKELSRLQRCAADGCVDVLVDLSRNSSRRFCSTSCANRTNVAAYRARKSGRAQH